MTWLDLVLQALGLAKKAKALDDHDDRALKKLRTEAKTAGQIAEEGEQAAKDLRDANRDRRP